MASVTDRKRSEVRIRIIEVFAFLLFQPTHHRIGHRRHNHLNADLKGTIEQYDETQCGIFPDSVKRNGIENQTVDTLPAEGRADGTGPQIFAMGEQFHLCHHIGIDKIAHPKRDDGSYHNTPGITEYGFERGLQGNIKRLSAGHRQAYDDGTHDGGKQDGEKTRPDHLAGPRIAIHFRQHITKDVTNGKKDIARTKYQNAPDQGQPAEINLADFGRTNQIGTDQYRDEARHQVIVVTIMTMAIMR